MTRFSVTLSLLCVLCGIISSYAYVYEDCGSQLGEINEITISSCAASDEKCLFTRGTDVHVSVKFTPSEDIPNLTAHAFGVLLDVPIALPIKKPDVCKDPDSGLKCPLKKGEVAEYKTSFVVEKRVPPISVDVVCEFRNDNDEKIICLKMPVKVV